MSSNGSVLITGCSDGGIGSGLALVFQARGYHVFATVRDPEKASALKDLPRVTLLTLEVTNMEDIIAAKHAVSVQTGGTLSYLINNAGRNHFMPLLDEDIAAAKDVFDINVWGPLAITQAFASLLMKAKGTLVNITSIAGHGAIPTLGKS
jgi:NAD(P)-dependent dehydrogenase (short-subunit alcohol dehydrogenase family)